MVTLRSGAGQLACLCALALSLGSAGCGSDAKDADKGGAEGGTAVVSATSYPDFLDPALSYSTLGWQLMWNVYTPLLTYAHAEGSAGSELIPGLAEALPDVSADGKTYRLKLRSGLQYSDATTVNASDFEHTIKRVLNLESGGSFYYLGIEGAEDYVKAGKAGGDIKGIVADDDTGEITIRLNAPDGTFSNVLALGFAGLVPGDTPFENQSRKPAPGVGAYRLDDVRTNRGFDLVKVPGFAVGDLGAAKLDRISLRVVSNRRNQTQDTIADKIDYMIDQPAPDQIRMVRDRFADDRFREFATSSTYFFFLNHRVAPFHDKRVRQAVNHAIDRNAIPRLYGGLLAPSCNYFPPQITGYRKLDPCPYGDKPDLAKARALVRAAGAEGDEVKVFGSSEPESRASAEYLADAMTSIGLQGRPQIVAGEVYLQTVGNAKTRAQAGFAAFFQDFPHPANFTTQVDGRAIQPTNSFNWGSVDDAQITTTLERAGREADLDGVAGDYAAVDRRIVEEAHVVPFGNRKNTVLYSDRIDAEGCTLWHPVYNLDLTRLCLR